jgi:uncharacterized protein (DUF305 family)
MRKIFAAVLLAISLITTFADSQHDHGASGADTATNGGPERMFVEEMNDGMRKMMQAMHAAGATGQPDIDFLAMMIPHHEGAVEMARLELIHGKDPLTRRLAEEIIASQTAEIAAMKKRLAILRQVEDTNPDGYPALHGTRGE